MADVAQGRSLGNCYFIAAIVALAENPERLKKLFVIQSKNEPGIIAFNIYFRGMPYVMTIDEKIPFTYFSNVLSPTFANIGTDGGLQGVLLEKLWAKINCNYEFTSSGW